MSTPVPAFADLTDLALGSHGGLVLGANDEFFAPKENLLKSEEPVWKEGEYTDRGKWMDGWETRRRRVPGHDDCVIKLAFRGEIRGVCVDTAFFRGNYPDACSIEGTVASVAATHEELTSAKTCWEPVLAESKLQGNSRNYFSVDTQQAFTHLRFHIYPDGGVARLRVYGEVCPELEQVGDEKRVWDLAALDQGGQVPLASDMFFGERQNMIKPGRAFNMGDGWETRRRRGPGHDWAIVRLATEGLIQWVEIDTNHFKGNYPDTCSLEACCAPDRAADDLARDEAAWTPLLAPTKLQAHTRHVFAVSPSAAAQPGGDGLRAVGPATHVRIRVYPDGGISRLRVHGTATASGLQRLYLRQLNALSHSERMARLLACCASPRWAEAVAKVAPYGTAQKLLAAAERQADALTDADWLEAFAGHPMIGDREVLRQKAAGWAGHEQGATRAATEAMLDALQDNNAAYVAKHGFIFITCATGKTAEQMLAELQTRVGNDRATELRNAAAEQRRITALRIGKLLELRRSTASASRRASVRGIDSGQCASVQRGCEDRAQPSRRMLEKSGRNQVHFAFDSGETWCEVVRPSSSHVLGRNPCTLIVAGCLSRT